jgi:hypothetical protein
MSNRKLKAAIIFKEIQLNHPLRFFSKKGRSITVVNSRTPAQPANPP